jgi:tetratricopeptide (TPR) repeat protein
LEIKNSDTFALKNKIYALENLKQYEKVIELCEEILSLSPNDIWALDSMGLSLNELNRHHDALKCYEKSLKIDSSDVTALMNTAISHSHMGNYQDAINFYDRAQILDSDLKEIPIAKSRLYEKLGMKDDAFLAAQSVLSTDMEKIKKNAKENKCSVFHQFCENEFEESNSK